MLDFYFLPKPFERSARMYELLGVRTFQKIVLGTAGAFVASLRPKNKLESYFLTKFHSVDALRTTERWSRFNEVVHTFFFFFCVAFILWYQDRLHASGTVFFVFFTWLNLWLVFLQRYNRVRILRAIGLLSAKTQLQ